MPDDDDDDDDDDGNNNNNMVQVDAEVTGSKKVSG